MVAGPLGVAGLAQRAAEAEVGIVVDLVCLDDGVELHRGEREAAAVEVGAAQRLADRRLLGCAPRGALELLGGVLVVLVGEQLYAPPVEGEGRVRFSVERHSRNCRRPPRWPR